MARSHDRALSDRITLQESGQKPLSNCAVAAGGICLTHDTWRARAQSAWRARAVQPKPLDGQAAHRADTHVLDASKEATHVSDGVVVHKLVRRRARGVVRGVGRGRNTPNTRDDRQKQRNTRNHGRLELNLDSSSKVPPFLQNRDLRCGLLQPGQLLGQCQAWLEWLWKAAPTSRKAPFTSCCAESLNDLIEQASSSAHTCVQLQ
jgi:hypothetical protein